MNKEDKSAGDGASGPIYVELVGAKQVESPNQAKDCLACRITGSGGLLAISIYLYSNAMKHPMPRNRVFINSIATGKSTYRPS